jgi:hypothetical protein
MTILELLRDPLYICSPFKDENMKCLIEIFTLFTYIVQSKQMLNPVYQETVRNNQKISTGLSFQLVLKS